MTKTITVRIPMRFAVRGGRKAILSESEHIEAQPRTENALLKAIAKAHRWRHQLENGEYASIAELAKAQRVNDSYACRLLRLSLLAPSIVADILDGRKNFELALKDLTKPLPLRWDQQRTILQFSTERPDRETSNCALMGQQGRTTSWRKQSTQNSKQTVPAITSRESNC